MVSKPIEDPVWSEAEAGNPQTATIFSCALEKDLKDVMVIPN